MSLTFAEGNALAALRAQLGLNKTHEMTLEDILREAEERLSEQARQMKSVALQLEEICPEGEARNVALPRAVVSLRNRLSNLFGPLSSYLTFTTNNERVLIKTAVSLLKEREAAMSRDAETLASNAKDLSYVRDQLVPFTPVGNDVSIETIVDALTAGIRDWRDQIQDLRDERKRIVDALTGEHAGSWEPGEDLAFEVDTVLKELRQQYEQTKGLYDLALRDFKRLNDLRDADRSMFATELNQITGGKGTSPDHALDFARREREWLMNRLWPEVKDMCETSAGPRDLVRAICEKARTLKAENDQLNRTLETTVRQIADSFARTMIDQLGEPSQLAIELGQAKGLNAALNKEAEQLTKENDQLKAENVDLRDRNAVIAHELSQSMAARAIDRAGLDLAKSEMDRLNEEIVRLTKAETERNSAPPRRQIVHFKSGDKASCGDAIHLAFTTGRTDLVTCEKCQHTPSFRAAKELNTP